MPKSLESASPDRVFKKKNRGKVGGKLHTFKYALVIEIKITIFTQALN